MKYDETPCEPRYAEGVGTNLTQFNQPEHAGLCLAGEMLIGAYIVCHYARTSLEASPDVATGQASPANWEIDALQEKMVQQWAEAKGCWFPHAEQDIESEYGTMIAEGAEAKVYYKKCDAVAPIYIYKSDGIGRIF